EGCTRKITATGSRIFNRAMQSQPQIPLTLLETGDRFEVYASPDGRALALPTNLLELDQPIAQLVDSRDHPLNFHLTDSADSLSMVEPIVPGHDGTDSLWLEYRGAGRFQLVVQPEAAPEQSREVATDP